MIKVRSLNRVIDQSGQIFTALEIENDSVLLVRTDHNNCDLWHGCTCGLYVSSEKLFTGYKRYYGASNTARTIDMIVPDPIVNRIKNPIQYDSDAL